MANPQWSPDESYLTKLERLAYALVRTKPEKEQCHIVRRKTLWIEKFKGLAGPFALTLLIGIPYIAENSSSPIIIASLLIAAVDACLTIWCYTDFEMQHGHCDGDLFTCLFNHIGEFPSFMMGWWWVSALTASFAACARTLSSIMDSVTGRHMETLLENTLGSFTPLGSPIDIISVGVISVPSIMCSIGMEESTFLKAAVLMLSSTTTLSLFGYALATNHLFPSTESATAAVIPPETSLYVKVLSGAALASIGFLSLYKICQPEDTTLTQHKHFHVSKKFSARGCLASAGAFLIYLIESSVINNVAQTPSLWDGDPPLLWPLQGGWRLFVASLAITALSLSTFEFLIPLCTTVTRIANDGLLYRTFSKTREDEPQWNMLTPLVFGVVAAMHSMLIDTKVLLGLVASNLLQIHIMIACSMIAMRYKLLPPITCSAKLKGHTKTRNPSMSSTAESHHDAIGPTGRRLLSVTSFNSGRAQRPSLSRPESSGSYHEAHRLNEQSLLVGDDSNAQDASGEPEEYNEAYRRESGYSVGSTVSGYETAESHIDPDDETDVDAVVTEYNEQIRVAAVTGTIPLLPTPQTCRRVGYSLVALIPVALSMAAAFSTRHESRVTGIMLAISSGLLMFLLVVVISRQPQRPQVVGSRVSLKEESRSKSIDYGIDISLVPWLPVGAVVLHSCLLLEAWDLAGTPFAFWLATGLIVYFSYSVTHSVAAPRLTDFHEHIHLTRQSRQSVSSAVPAPCDSYLPVDTVILA